MELYHNILYRLLINNESKKNQKCPRYYLLYDWE